MAELQSGQLATAAGLNTLILNPPVTATGSTTQRFLADRVAEIVNVMDYGATGDGSTDDTTAIQAAADAVPSDGGVLFFPAAKEFKFAKTVFVKPYTEVRGGGWSTVLSTMTDDDWDNPTFTATSGTWFTPGNVFFCNSNWDTTTLVDGYIKLRNIRVNCGPASASVRKALAHFHRCRHIEVAGVMTVGGGGQVACMGTDQTNFHDNVFLNYRTSAVDHFAGFTNARVHNNYFLKDPSTAAEPSIQATGSNGDNTANYSTGFICTSNRVFGGAANVYAIGITNRDATSTVNDVLIANNMVDVNSIAGGGIGLYGGGDNWVIVSNTVKNVAQYVAIGVFPNGFGDPTRPHVANNRVLDSTYTSGGATLINVLADGATVIDNDVLDSTATTGTHVDGAACLLRVGNTAGSTLTNNYTTTGTVTVDGQTSGSWTPVVTFGGASTGITYSTQSGTYVRQGNLVYIECDLVLTSKGSATGNAQITGIPFADVSGSTPPCRMHVRTLVNTNSITEDPLIRVNDDRIVIAANGRGGSNLTDANFANNTNLSFSGWYRTG